MYCMVDFMYVDVEAHNILGVFEGFVIFAKWWLSPEKNGIPFTEAEGDRPLNIERVRIAVDGVVAELVDAAAARAVGADENVGVAEND